MTYDRKQLKAILCEKENKNIYNVLSYLLRTKYIEKFLEVFYFFFIFFLFFFIFFLFFFLFFLFTLSSVFFDWSIFVPLYLETF